MRVSTLDPISLADAAGLEAAPYIVEGQHEGAIKIYFRSEENRRAYLEMEMHGSTNSAGLKAIFDDVAESAIAGNIN